MTIESAMADAHLSVICYPRYDEHPGMHTGATRMHTGERPYGNPPYATATWHRRRYEAGAAPTTTAYRWFGPWFGLTPPRRPPRPVSAGPGPRHCWGFGAFERYGAVNSVRRYRGPVIEPSFRVTVLQRGGGGLHSKWSVSTRHGTTPAQRARQGLWRNGEARNSEPRPRSAGQKRGHTLGRRLPCEN